ncbi:BMC domain-containing protein [Calidifontibacillus erzurumensis]|uniref:BMC domain-containing protein n=1 Tax=Calidifontibacillus erzurumensis TaxID=2741433 RepID=A0A8J8K8P4_9BACI|nr:BMC domain-containing protein [Calidifontibacillus erzurumensis]NSL52146.1 BMC domain-containing protein [Calidifontibacillus erzurumensis]
MKVVEAIGIVELQYFTYALEIADQMMKAAGVELLKSENYLGGRLVSLVIGGSISDVKTAIEVAKETCESKQQNPLKMAVLITNPHREILKFIVSSEKEDEKNQSEQEAIEQKDRDENKQNETQMKQKRQSRRRNSKNKTDDSRRNEP